MFIGHLRGLRFFLLALPFLKKMTNVAMFAVNKLWPNWKNLPVTRPEYCVKGWVRRVEPQTPHGKLYTEVYQVSPLLTLT